MEANIERALRIIADRRWKNGYLVELAKKALAGESVTVDDFDYQQKDKEARFAELMAREF